MSDVQGSESRDEGSGFGERRRACLGGARTQRAALPARLRRPDRQCSEAHTCLGEGGVSAERRTKACKLREDQAWKFREHMPALQSSGFRVQGAGCRLQGAGFRV